MKKRRPVIDLSRNRPGSQAAAKPKAGDESGKSKASIKMEDALPLPDLRWLIAGGLFLAGVVIWAYWPTLVEAERAWNRQPDYSHGYLVVPMALFILWMNRSHFPRFVSPSLWIGISLIALSIVMRLGGAALHLSSVDGWSMLPLVAGSVAALAGWRVMLWAAPAIGFLWFLIPIPFRLEDALSHPLQRISTIESCFALQCLGQPAVAEGNVIYLGENVLEIAQACSGLRLLVGVFALSYLFIAVTRGPWWEKVVLLLAAVPIALVANATRIVATGLLYQYVSSDAGRHFSHDFAGWVMIPWAALLFGVVLWYVRKLVPEVEVPDMADVVQKEFVQKEFST